MRADIVKEKKHQREEHLDVHCNGRKPEMRRHHDCMVIDEMPGERQMLTRCVMSGRWIERDEKYRKKRGNYQRDDDNGEDNPSP